MGSLKDFLKEDKEKPTIEELRNISREERKRRSVFKKHRNARHIGGVGHDYCIINFYDKKYSGLSKLFSGIKYAEEKKRRHLFNSKYSVVIDKENEKKAVKALNSAGFEIHKDYDCVLFRFSEDYI